MGSLKAVKKLKETFKCDLGREIGDKNRLSVKFALLNMKRILSRRKDLQSCEKTVHLLKKIIICMLPNLRKKTRGRYLNKR